MTKQNLNSTKSQEKCSKPDTLVARAQAGDKAAFDSLLLEARPRAMAVAMKVLRNPSDAEDAVQDAMMKVWRYLPRFEGRASFFTWIHRIVTNTSLDLLRKAKLRQDGREDAGEDDAHPIAEGWHEETPAAILESEQDRSMVHAAMAELSPVHREALQLRELEDRSYEEIAAIAACPIGTVMSRLHHARRRLQEQLSAARAAETARYLDAALDAA